MNVAICYCKMGEIKMCGGDMIDLLKFICLVVLLWFTIITIVRLIMHQDIPGANFLVWALSSAGFIWLQWL